MATEKKEEKTLINIKVATDAIKPVDVKIMAESIKSVADNMSKVLGSGLTMRAICVLIHNAMPIKERIGLADIENVLLHASNLRKYTSK